MDIDTELETKAGIPHDAVATHSDMMRAFEAFKEANDERCSTPPSAWAAACRTSTPSR